jgi:hypothetical protein
VPDAVGVDGDLLQAAPADDAFGSVVGDQTVGAEAREFVGLLEQQPAFSPPYCRCGCAPDSSRL